MVKAGKIKLDTIPTGFINSNGKHKIADYHLYADAHWGEKTQAWTASASRLSNEKWELICQAALSHVNNNLNDGKDDGMDTGGVDPRVFIKI